MAAVFGPDSAAGLVGLALGPQDTVLAMAAGLSVMQIVYRPITVVTVGPGGPVVLTNLGVVVLHAAALAVWLQDRAPA